MGEPTPLYEIPTAQELVRELLEKVKERLVSVSVEPKKEVRIRVDNRLVWTLKIEDDMYKYFLIKIQK